MIELLVHRLTVVNQRNALPDRERIGMYPTISRAIAQVIALARAISTEIEHILSTVII